MALLGALIDQRTNVSIDSNANTSFAHGLPAAPDLVFVRETASSASSVSAITFEAIFNATNVTIYNSGQRASTNFQVTSVVFHSMLR